MTATELHAASETWSGTLTVPGLEPLDREQRKLVIDPRGSIRSPDQQRAVVAETPPVHPGAKDEPPAKAIIRNRMVTAIDVPVDTLIRKLREKGYLPE